MKTNFSLPLKKVFVIAEVGCNHNGDISVAERLIEIAAKSGADAVKFQSFTPDNMTIKEAPKAEYQIKATGTSETQFQRLERMKLDKEKHKRLINTCNNNGIIFCSSPFDNDNAQMLHDLNVPFFKIPSGEITNVQLIKLISSFNKPIILSTGMSTLGEIEDALSIIGSNESVILMHCVSDYPARWEEANLRTIQTLKNAFHTQVGFSDHTQGIELAMVAVGLGAVVIEKHITLDKNMHGGDHKASLEPKDFASLVEKIRTLEIALGDGIKRCMPSEKSVRLVARKSIVSTKHIRKGQIISENDVAIKRPGTGIQPKYINLIIGSTAIKDIHVDKLINWENVTLGYKNDG